MSSAAKKGSKMMAELLDLGTLRLVILKDTVLVRWQGQRMEWVEKGGISSVAGGGRWVFPTLGGNRARLQRNAEQLEQRRVRTWRWEQAGILCFYFLSKVSRGINCLKRKTTFFQRKLTLCDTESMLTCAEHSLEVHGHWSQSGQYNCVSSSSHNQMLKESLQGWYFAQRAGEWWREAHAR